MRADVQQELLRHIRADTTTPFHCSQLYSALEAKKFVDVETRSSRYRLITTTQAFDLAASIVTTLNALDPTYDYVLFRNDITQIQYQQGDFFKAHEDYLSLTSNAIVEFTMLLCMGVSDDLRGGETVFHVNEWFQHISKASITPGHVLVFRKDIRHEGRLLEQGTKEILTFNLLGVPKKCETIIAVRCAPDPVVDPSEQSKFKLPKPLAAAAAAAAVVVKIAGAGSRRCDNISSLDAMDDEPSPPDFAVAAASSSSSSSASSSNATTTLVHASSSQVQVPHFFIPLSMVRNSGSLLEAFANTQEAHEKSGLIAKQHIWFYEDRQCSVGAFSVLHKIYSKCYITFAEFKQHRALIDFYGFRISDLLIDVAQDIAASVGSVAASSAAASSAGPTSSSASASAASSPVQQATPSSSSVAPSQRQFGLADDVWLCQNEAHAQHLGQLVLTEHLPYVRFKMILAEGVLTYGGGLDGTPATQLQMTPLWVVFGDKWHVLIKSRFLTTGMSKKILTN